METDNKMTQDFGLDEENGRFALSDDELQFVIGGAQSSRSGEFKLGDVMFLDIYGTYYMGPIVAIYPCNSRSSSYTMNLQRKAITSGNSITVTEVSYDYSLHLEEYNSNLVRKISSLPAPGVYPAGTVFN